MAAHYLRINNEVRCPYSEDEIKASIQSGGLMAETPICVSGGECHSLADVVADFYEDPSEIPQLPTAIAPAPLRPWPFGILTPAAPRSRF